MAGDNGPFWVYILQNPDGVFYVGSTGDLDRRLLEHNNPARAKSKYSRKHGPWTLVWSEAHPDRAQAMARERQIKAMKSARWIRESLLNW